MIKKNLKTMGKYLSAAILTASMFVALPAGAASIFLNGVNIDGIVGETFKNCTVQIDGKGDVYITAKGYQIQSVGGGGTATSTPVPTNPAPVAVVPAAPGAAQAPAAPVAPQSAITPTGPISMRYWLVSENAAPGMSQYEIDVYINNSHVKRVSGKEAQVVLDITNYMKAGENTVYLVATKDTTGGRKSTSPQHSLKVIIGESSKSDSKEVYIDKEVLSYTRTAAEDRNFSDMFKVTAR